MFTLGEWRRLVRRHDDMIATGALDADDAGQREADYLNHKLAHVPNERLALACFVRVVASGEAVEGDPDADTMAHLGALLLALRRRDPAAARLLASCGALAEAQGMTQRADVLQAMAAAARPQAI